MDSFDLRIDGGTQPRERLDEATVQRYADAMADGLWDFARVSDPAVAFYDGSVYWLADGFHRLEAAKRAGKLDEFAACLDVRQGTQRDAILYSVGANAHHGWPRSMEDKRRAVFRLLGDPEWGKWSDREIARRCCVTHPFVGRLRAATGTVTSERTYTRGGAVARMDVANIGRTGQRQSDAGSADDLVAMTEDEWHTLARRAREEAVQNAKAGGADAAEMAAQTDASAGVHIYQRLLWDLGAVEKGLSSAPSPDEARVMTSAQREDLCCRVRHLRDWAQQLITVLNAVGRDASA